MLLSPAGITEHKKVATENRAQDAYRIGRIGQWKKQIQ